MPCAKIKRGRECALCQNSTHGIYSSPSMVCPLCQNSNRRFTTSLLRKARHGVCLVPKFQASIYDIHSPTIAITRYANGWHSNGSEFVTIQTAKLISSCVSLTTTHNPQFSTKPNRSMGYRQTPPVFTCVLRRNVAYTVLILKLSPILRRALLTAWDL